MLFIAHAAFCHLRSASENAQSSGLKSFVAQDQPFFILRLANSRAASPHSGTDYRGSDTKGSDTRGSDPVGSDTRGSDPCGNGGCK